MSTAKSSIPGIHHVTAITGDAQRNIDFYCGVLGLRLVKLTVNFDDPGSYHLYYGDELGRPGTVMTFFAWAGAFPGRVGPPQATATAFAVPASAVDYWTERLEERFVRPQEVDRFGERVLTFTDPDGTRLELVGAGSPKGRPWVGGPVPEDRAIRGFHSVTISEEGYEATAHLLTEVMGYGPVDREDDRFRYRAAGDGLAATVDLVCVPGARRGTTGSGAVHHVAFRVADDAEQYRWREDLVGRSLNVSPVMDRSYFHSIYFREPGGVLFELATENPGFTADQPADELGTRLMLPRWLESRRAEIDRAVTPLRLPASRESDRR